MTGGPPQYDLQVTQPIDWFLFGKRAANMAREALGVRVSEADYADQVRQRVSRPLIPTSTWPRPSPYVSWPSRTSRTSSVVEAATRKAVEAGGRPQVELNRVRLDS